MIRLIVLYTLLLVSIVTCSGLEFPSNFVFGTATAAYQIEGAYKEDGRGYSIWDIFSHEPGHTYKGETGDVADDHYHRVDEDVQLMKDMGLKHYRMSLSWSRILPSGVISSVNQKGIDHYNYEIDALRKAGIDVYVTLYHWDLPMFLEKMHNGWLNTTLLPKVFGEYADLCFKEFGDRVKHWITINEPLSTSLGGYDAGVFAPGRCTKCPAGGDSKTEPYIVGHTQLLAHAEAVKIYREKYQKTQNGTIGIALNSEWTVPLTDKPEDIEAAERVQEFQIGWFFDPIFFGDYPTSMKKRVGDRLPKFTEQERQMLNGSADFFAINHYTSKYVYYRSQKDCPLDWGCDSEGVTTPYDKDGKTIGEPADSSWLFVVPKGIRGMLNWLKNRYNNIPVYITENGCDVPNEAKLPVQKVLNDTFRVNYLQSYLEEISKAIVEDKCDVKGYFVWSLLDNFEWVDGYSKKFGIHYVDYTSRGELRRYRKESAQWYSSLIQNY